MGQSFEEWWGSLKPVTRGMTVIALLLTAASSFSIIEPFYLVLLPQAVTKFQVWRLVTSAMYFGPFSFQWLMAMMMFVSYIRYNEETDYVGKRADMVWMIMVMVAALSAGGLLAGFYLTSTALTMSLCWVFCKRHPTQRLSIYAFEFQANMFPWVLMAFHLIIGSSVAEDVLGIVVGHGFLFLRDILPRTHKVNLCETPAWLKKQLPDQRVAMAGVHINQTFRPAAAANPAPRPQQYNWGRGRALGTQ